MSGNTMTDTLHSNGSDAQSPAHSGFAVPFSAGQARCLLVDPLSRDDDHERPLERPGRHDDIERRLAALENSVNLLTAHASQLQGGVGTLSFLAAIDILNRARCAENPYEALKNYISATCKNGRKVKAPRGDDPNMEALIQAGIDDALSEHVALLMQLSGNLPGAPQQPHG